MEIKVVSFHPGKKKKNCSSCNCSEGLRSLQLPALLFHGLTRQTPHHYRHLRLEINESERQHLGRDAA